MKLSPFLCLALLPLLTSAAAGALDRGYLLRTIDADCRSARIAVQVKEWSALSDLPHVRERKQELAKQLNEVRRRDEVLRRRVVTCLDRVQKSGDINARGEGGTTLLMAVAATGVDDAVAIVLREQPELDAQDDRGRTALRYEEEGMGHELSNLLQQRWQQALAAGDAEAVEQLLNSGLSPDTPTAQGNPPIGEALEHGRSAIYDALLRRECSVTHPMADGRSLLEVAAEHKNAAAIAHLLQFGADPDTRLLSGEPLLRLLLRRGDSACVQAFVRGASLGNRAEADTLLTCLAARLSSADTVRALLGSVENPHAEDAYGNTPLLEAARRGDVAVYDAVTDSRPPAWENSRGETALMHAALSGKADMVRRVLETMPAELRDKRDAAGRSAADYAALHPTPAAVLKALDTAPKGTE